MRFAESGYYLEAYVKCANCGVLIVSRAGGGTRRARPAQLYCSPWCEQWHAKRLAELKPPPARPAAAKG